MRRTNGVVRVLLSTALVATVLGAAAPTAEGAEASDGSGGHAGTISYGADSEQGGRAVLWKNGRFTDYGNLAAPNTRTGSKS